MVKLLGAPEPNDVFEIVLKHKHVYLSNLDKNSSMRIELFRELFRDNKLNDRETGIVDIWNDKVEAKVAKFLNFAKN